jgi:hypothetical protein
LVSHVLDDVVVVVLQVEDYKYALEYVAHEKKNMQNDHNRVRAMEEELGVLKVRA